MVAPPFNELAKGIVASKLEITTLNLGGFLLEITKLREFITT